MTDASAQRIGPARRAGPPVNVLLVDDRPENLMALEAVLADERIRVVTAGSGDEALEHLLHEDFAVILMDVQMPGLDGFETVRLIKRRAHTQHIPIIFVTAIYLDDAHRREGYATGAVDYILKPFEPDILRSKVDVFVDLYEQQAATARRAVELDRLQRVFRGLLHHLPIGVAFLDRELHFRLVNQVAADQLGVPVEALLGRPFADAYPQGDARAAAALAHVLRHLAPAAAFTRTIEREGRPSYWDQAYYPVLDATGALDGVLMLGVEVSPNAAQAAPADHRSADALKSDILAAASHELRTPLTSIMGYAEFLEDQIGGPLTPEQLGFVRQIQAGGKRLKGLVDDLLDYARLEAGRMELACDAADLDGVLEEALAAVQPHADVGKVTLALDGPGSPARAPMDRQRVVQVLMHLVGNAVKFTAPGGRVDVVARREDEELIVEIHDTGVGIAPEHLPHVFERFYQVDPSATREKGGTGLGLSIAKALVEAHGGAIGAISEPGRGSTFWFTLPLHPARGCGAA